MHKIDDFRIDEACINDADKLAQLGREIFLEAFGDRYSESDREDHIKMNYTTGHYEQLLLQDTTCLLYAHTTKELLGYALGWPCSLPVDVQGTRAFELRRLYVRKTVKGAGVAQKLLQSFIQWSKNHAYERLYVGIWEGNYRQRAYRRNGFSFVGRHSFQIGQQKDTDLIFMKELQGV